MKKKDHIFDFCVIGGGVAGMCAAIAASRCGLRTALIHDRPVLGGNASSEIRMWICGADRGTGSGFRETGLIEEIELENMYRNPMRNYSLWDSLLYEKVRYQKNLEIFLNCSVNSAETSGKNRSGKIKNKTARTEEKIQTVTAWQMTSETWHTFTADYFADCSGDAILASLTSAECRIGREARSEFNESIAPAKSDTKTMGMSCLFQLRETKTPQKFIPPHWANKYESDEDLPLRGHTVPGNNFWWLELGGEEDSIHDTEVLRDRLLGAAMGVWDHIKNKGNHGAENWELDWIGFVPGKRESRRYTGDYIITQNDVEAGGKFDDIVAYGGWPMDDHNPAGLLCPGAPTIFHPAPQPWGIPFRSLYSKNISNLFFAGRNISATHSAMSSSRVMRTCAVMGEAVGNAAFIAKKNHTSPRGVYKSHIRELQQKLMDNDCYLPGLTRAVPEMTLNASIKSTEGNTLELITGKDRPIGNEKNFFEISPEQAIEYSFATEKKVSEIRVCFDSDFSRLPSDFRQRCDYPLNQTPVTVAASLVRNFRVETLENNTWKTVYSKKDNCQRFYIIPLDLVTHAIRIIPETTWGAEKARLYRFDVR